ncbi:hypothetical protein ILYODFUR_021066 [Ilyodon furcidens]|uniref:Uncharacterized protein n=1 Tax=Ilyodon furcidens TaxID=33524 RepID=A0ABV0TBQ7_9TELE
MFQSHSYRHFQSCSSWNHPGKQNWNIFSPGPSPFFVGVTSYHSTSLNHIGKHLLQSSNTNQISRLHPVHPACILFFTACKHIHIQYLYSLQLHFSTRFPLRNLLSIPHILSRISPKCFLLSIYITMLSANIIHRNS